MTAKSLELPSGVSPSALRALLDETRRQEGVLRAILRRFEERYELPLPELEARLARGDGLEHPDWEDSIEWRNAEEALQRALLTRRLLEWLLPSSAPSLAS